RTSERSTLSSRRCSRHMWRIARTRRFQAIAPALSRRCVAIWNPLPRRGKWHGGRHTENNMMLSFRYVLVIDVSQGHLHGHDSGMATNSASRCNRSTFNGSYLQEGEPNVSFRIFVGGCCCEPWFGYAGSRAIDGDDCLYACRSRTV